MTQTIEQKIAALEPKLASAREAHARTGAKVAAYHTLIRKLVEQRDAARAHSGLDLTWLLDMTSGQSEAKYNALKNFLWEDGARMMPSGYWQKEQQSCVQLYMKSGDTVQLDAVVGKLEKLLPHLAVVREFGGKIITILDYDCGSSASYMLRINDEGVVDVFDSRDRYGRTKYSSEKVFSSLREGVEWVQQNRPADRPEGIEYDDDELL
jgi:hypothetical protein